ncbi:MAG TPA: hypothetical protein VGF97_12350 [Rhizomicrobium sp.]|jgi:hypothetical protein
MKLTAIAAMASLLSACMTGAYAQTATVASPLQLAQESSGGAGTSGGATSGGAGSTAPAEAPPAPAMPAPLAPGGAAGAPAAAVLSDAALVGLGATALVVGVALAVTNGGGHGSTTTTVGK